MPEAVLCDVFQVNPDDLTPVELGKIVSLKEHLENRTGAGMPGGAKGGD
jgi:hypothetical protein